MKNIFKRRTAEQKSTKPLVLPTNPVSVPIVNLRTLEMPDEETTLLHPNILRPTIDVKVSDKSK